MRSSFVQLSRARGSGSDSRWTPLARERERASAARSTRARVPLAGDDDFARVDANEEETNETETRARATLGVDARPSEETGESRRWSRARAPRSAKRSEAPRRDVESHDADGRSGDVKTSALGVGTFASSVALNREVLEAKDLSALAKVVERAAGEMSDVNVSTTFSTLAKFMTNTTRFRLEDVMRSEWFNALEARALEILPKMKPRSVAQVVWACARLRRSRRPERDLFWDALEAGIERCVIKFEPQGIANTAWAYAKMDMRIPSRIRDALEADIVKNASKYKAYELSIAFWGLTKFGHRPSMRLVEVFERKMLNWFEFCEPQQLSNIAASYARVKGCGTPAFLNAIAQESFARLNEFKGNEFGMLLWGLSNAGYFLADEDAELILHEVEARTRTVNTAEIALIVGSFATFSDVETSGFGDKDLRSFYRFSESTRAKLSKGLSELEDAFLNSMATCSCDDLSYIIWAFARLTHRPSDEFVSLFEDQALSRLDACTPQNLANIMYGFSTLRLNGVRLLTTASFYVMEKLDKFTSVELFMVYAAFSNSSYDPGPQMMLRLERTALPMVETFSPSGLTEFLRVFAKLRYMLAVETFAAVCERCSSCSEQYNSYNMSMTLWSYAQLGKQPCEGVLNRFNDELQGSKKPFHGQDFGLALWSLIVLGTLANSSKVTIRLMRSLVRLNDGVLTSSSELTTETLCCLYMARLVSIGTSYEPLVLGATAKIADDCKTAWLAMKTRDPTISKLQSDVSTSLEELGIPFELEAPVQGGLIRPDIVLAERRVVIEVDGPHHFSYDSEGVRRLLGSTQMRNNLLQSWGWRVRTVPYHEWADLLTAREKRAYLQKLLVQ